jgi:predicted nucleotidyltransferase
LGRGWKASATAHPPGRLMLAPFYARPLPQRLEFKAHSLAPGASQHLYWRLMDAKPLLVEIGALLRKLHLEAVLIGNAAAALQGAPVTTVDLDFLFRKTPANLRKLKAIARELRGTILRPYYPASGLYRIVRDDDGLQLDFMTTIHGIRSFEGVRARAVSVEIETVPILVASLEDIVKSKKAARRPRDLAVLQILEKALEETARPKRKARSARARK